MSNTRFLHTNYLEASAAALVVDPPTAGGTVRSEASGYVMENVMYADRRSLWKLASGTSIDVYFDLTGAASNKSVAAAALLGHRPTTTAGLGITSCVVATAPHAGGGFGAAAFTNQGTISMSGGARDGGVTFNATSARWLRYAITAFDNFTLGRMWAGALDIDLGLISSAGAPRRHVQPRVEADTIGGEKVATWLGDGYFIASLPFSPTDLIDATTRSKLLTLARKRQTVVYIDHNDVFHEVIVDWRDSLENDVGPYYAGELDVVQLG